MVGTAGDGEPVEGIRASDAERDATAERLSAATGEGRLTLEEFSQRMERATTARTRGELDHLVADLPAGAGVAGTAVAERAQAGPSWHVSPIGGLRVYGPWRMDRHVIVISLIGGTRLDLSQAELAAPEVTLTKVSLVAGYGSGSRRDPGRGVGLQPDRRHQSRGRAGSRPRRADGPHPRVLAGRRGPDPPRRAGPPVPAG